MAHAGFPAFPSPFDAAVPAEDGWRTYAPARPLGQFTYTGRDAAALFAYLDYATNDGGHPAAEYDGIGHRVYALPVAEARALFSTMECGSHEVVAVVEYPGGLTRLGPADEGRFPVHFLAGQTLRDIAGELLSGMDADRTLYAGLLKLFGNDLPKQLATIAEKGYAKLKNLAGYLSWARLLALHNSLASCATDRFAVWRREGYLFDSLQSLVDRVFDGEFFERQFHQLLTVLERSQAPKAIDFTDRGARLVEEALGVFRGVSDYLPRIQSLTVLFWRTFNRLLAKHRRAFQFAERLATARRTFEEHFFWAAGNTLYTELLGQRGRDLRDKTGPMAELAIGGGLVGALPFALGTIFQILVDLFELVKNLLWYGRWVVQGLLEYLLRPPGDNPDGLVEPDPSLLDLFTFGFNPDEVPGQLLEIAGLVSKMGGKLLESFLTDAAYYGQVAGKGAAAGAMFVGEGAVSLLLGPYPDNYNLLGHLGWQLKRWFNIGCCLGPIVVDIVLLFCSGGISGVFSLAVKAGKVGKVRKLFRFATVTGEWLADSKLYLKLATYVPQKLRLLLQGLIRQLYALSGRVSDQLTTLLRVVNEKLPAGSGRWTGRDLDQLATRLDNWYDLAGATEFFLGIIYLILGEEDAQITPQGQLATV